MSGLGLCPLIQTPVKYDWSYFSQDKELGNCFTSTLTLIIKKSFWGGGKILILTVGLGFFFLVCVSNSEFFLLLQTTLLTMAG